MMKSNVTAAALTSIGLITALAGEVTAQQRDPAKDKANKASRVVRLTLEAPPAPVVLDVALSGKIPIRLWAENISDKPIILCRPVDGSYVVERDPAYVFRLVDESGREVRRSKNAACPWNNSLQAGDFITVRPKEKVDLLKSAGSFGDLTTYLFAGLQPGEYQLTLTYIMNGDGKTGGKPAGQPSPRVPALLEKSLRGEVTSNTVKLRFIPAPGTDELLKILDGKGEKALSPADALLVLGHRRDERGYRPMLAALSHQDWEVRWAAAFSLRHYSAAYSVGQLKDKDIIPPELIESLAKAAKDPDYRVREIAAISLRFTREYLDLVKSEKKPGQKDTQQGSAEPKDLKLTARLIAKENVYPLDLGGKTPDQFRKMLDQAKAKGGDLPVPPTVDFALEFKNTGKTDLHLCLGKGDVGPVNGLTMELKGPEVLSASFMNARGARVSPTIVTVAAGKTHTVAITKLESYDGRTTQAWYWTKAGEYTLTVSCGVVEGGEKGFWQAAGKVVSAPIKLKVGGK